MTVARRLLAMLLVAALVPLVISALTTIRIHEGALTTQIRELHRTTATDGARVANSSIDGVRRTVSSLARTIPWSRLSADERDGALWLVYEQLDELAIVSLLDADGAGLGLAAYRDAGDEGLHPAVTTAALERFGAAIPLAEVLSTRAAVAAPVDLPGDPDAAIVLGVAVDGDADQPWVLAVAMSLRGVCRDLDAARPREVSTRLVDPTGRALCAAGPPIAPETDVLTVSAPGPMGWQVVVAQPTARAFAAATRIRRQSIYWVGVGILGALAAALWLGRSIRKPLDRLTAAANEVAAGRLDHRVVVTSRDELGMLGAAFNRMGGEIARQDAEIRGWNQELQGRVDERTRELRDAQEQLLESRKLSAMATLGAGVAHEINNPLTGVIGLTQVVLARTPATSPDRRALESIEREALRIRAIVEKVSALQVDRAARAPVKIDELLERVAATTGSTEIELVRDYARGLPTVHGDGAQLEHAFRQVIDNAVAAMTPGGGRLTLRTRLVGGGELFCLEIIDTGRGMTPEVVERCFDPFFTTKDDWSAHGLGLAVAERILVAHDGRIRASSRPGEGTTMTMTMPLVRRRAHLS